jgi:hypothetical protein
MKYTQDNLNDFNDESVLKSHNTPSQIDGFFSPLSITFLEEALMVDVGAHLMLYFDGQNWVCGPMKFSTDQLLSMRSYDSISCKQMDACLLVIDLINGIDFDPESRMLCPYSKYDINRIAYQNGSATTILVLTKMAESCASHEDMQIYSQAIASATIDDGKKVDDSVMIHARRYVDYLVEQMQKAEENADV